MTTITGSFTSAGVSSALSLGNQEERIAFSVGGTFSGVWQVEQSVTPQGEAWEIIDGPNTSTAAGAFSAPPKARVRIRCVSRASGTLTYSLADEDAIVETVWDSDGNPVMTVRQGGVVVQGYVQAYSMDVQVLTAQTFDFPDSLTLSGSLEASSIHTSTFTSDTFVFDNNIDLLGTLSVAGASTIGDLDAQQITVGGNQTFAGDDQWGLFGEVETDSTGAPFAFVSEEGKKIVGEGHYDTLTVNQGSVVLLSATTATIQVVNADTLDLDGNQTFAGDDQWGLFGEVETDSTGAPFALKGDDGVVSFGAVRVNNLSVNTDPTEADHAATKKYVDEASGGTSGAYTGIELEARDAQALAQSMAVRDQTNATVATPCWTYSHIIHYGQSFALGFGSAGLISTTAGPDGTFSFGSRPANTVATDVFTQSGAASLLDLTITAGAEVPAIGMVNFLRRSQLATYNLASDSTRQLVVNAAGKGGTALADLSKGATPTEYYGQLTDLMDKSHTAAGVSPYGIAGLCLLQGEQDYSAGTSEATYKTTLETFATDFATDAKTETSQTYDPALFLCQTSSDWDSGSDISAIGNAQLSAAQANANIYLIGPYYAYPDDGTKHLTDDGYRWLGEQFGKVLHKVLVKGEGWLPCHITAAWFRGDKVLLEYHTPEPPLQVQAVYLESTPTTFDNLGFRLGDDAGPITISAIEVKKSSVVITMDRETSTAANPWVQYAGNATYDGAGNICDSDPTKSYATDSVSGDPYSLWNWAVGQRLTLTEDV